jgi:hypothetical protein
MSLETIPIFYYIESITNDNLQLNFIEPNAAATELTANLNVGSYTLSSLGTEVARALNAAGQNTYAVTLDRDLRKYTISADDDFNLLVDTGTNSSSSAYSTIGFTGSDRTGGSSYQGDAAGTVYEPQFYLKGYSPFSQNKGSTYTKVNEAASGTEIEVVTYGSKRTMEFTIDLITNLKGSVHYDGCEDIDHVQAAKDFLDFITDKNKLEFMEDKSATSDFSAILLEATDVASDGSGYRLKNLYSRNLPKYFETGKLRFRQL